ncbi:hypothetical protein Igag_1528 [Ignisphaera aggregans DSM 17230]|uniref:Uncharacterized protein n=1 Tax=Ignisphaera aggregans (strain DSM 17230 / JCM 13409 / AQ1.S1) TaxID=583356 RepID=E0SR00_IGNAA|nr:hypothetical protein Igag_1528 [Ignisphaera aggregans DSM 17230]
MKAKGKGRNLRVPSSCPINFDFSVNRIECKICRYFDICLKINNKAMSLAKGISPKR